MTAEPTSAIERLYAETYAEHLARATAAVRDFTNAFAAAQATFTEAQRVMSDFAARLDAAAALERVRALSAVEGFRLSGSTCPCAEEATR